jgi:transcriptional regulator with XRE-family HTH domain
MKNTTHLQAWLSERVADHGFTAEYARFIKVSHPSITAILKGNTASLRQGMIDSICAAEHITEEDLFSISKGRTEHFVAESGEQYRTRPDTWTRLAKFLRTESSEQLQHAILSMAATGGFVPGYNPQGVQHDQKENTQKLPT